MSHQQFAFGERLGNQGPESEIFPVPIKSVLLGRCRGDV